MFLSWTDAETKKVALASYADAFRPDARENHVVRAAYRNVAPNTTVRDGYSRDDYDYFRPGEELPTGDKDIQSACMTAYRRFPIVRSVVDMMVDFVVKGIDVVHPSERVQKYGKQWFKSVKGKKVARKIARNLFRTAAAPVRRKSRKLPQATIEQLKKLGHSTAATAAVPTGYTVLNTVTVDAIGDELNPFVDPENVRYGVRVPGRLTDRIVKKAPADQGLTNLLPPEVLDSLRGGKLVPLDPKDTVVVHYQKDDHEVWGTPILYPLLDDLQMLVKLKGADRAALDGAVSSVRLWNLGHLDGADSIFPTRDMIEYLSGILANNVGGGVMDLVWGPDLHLSETSTEIAKFLGIAKYVPTLAAIFQGLGIPPSLAGMSDGGGMTNNFVSLRVLVERLEACRDELVEFFEAELALVQKAFGFREPFRLTFDLPALGDDSVEKKLLIELMDRDVVSAEMVVERFNGDPDIEAARVRRDLRKRKAGKLPPKAGQFHVDSQQQAQLERIALQQGETTPSEHGIELKPRKDGEVPVNEKNAARKRKEAKLAAKAPPKTNGRPLGSKDGVKRPAKRVAPKQGVAELVLWAMAAREKIAADLRPDYLAMKGKATARMLTTDEAATFERLVFGALAAADPGAEPDVPSLLGRDLAVPPEVDALYRHAVADRGDALTAEDARRCQALAVALAAAV